MPETVSKAVANTEPQAIQIAKQYRDRFEAVLPDHIDGKQFLGLAAGALYRDDKLLEAAENAPGEFLNALMRCAGLGHQPGTEEFYLIPRRNKKHGNKTEVQGLEGYRGIVERMYRSGAVASVIVREVCERDEFEFIEGQHDRPVHRIDWFGGKRGEMVGVYAYAVLTTGAVSRVVILNRDDVMAAKASSDGANSDYSPWNRLDGGKDHPEFKGRSMWWKTAARRLEPWVPTSAEYRREQLRAAVEADNARVRDTPHGPVTEQPVPYDPSTGEVVDAELVEEEPTLDAEWPEARKPGSGISDPT